MADLAQCGRCQAFTLVDKTGPVAVAVDIAPLGVVGYRAALMAVTALYRAEKRQNGATKLSAARVGSPVSFDPVTGAQEGTQRLHAEHPCPASAQKVVKTTAPKGSAPATPGAPPAGNLLHDALAAVAQDRATRSPATTATLPRSSAYPVCGTCQRNIPNGKLFTGVQHGPVWIWAECEKCE